MKDLVASIQTMSSREIAELTAKQHQHVKRDCEVMFTELEMDASSFGHIYLDSMNRQQTEYLLTFELVQTLITGYSIKLRFAVIQRLNELESKIQKPVQPVIALPQNYKEALLALVAAEEEKEKLLIERDYAIATKSQISDKKTAQAMNTASQAVKKLKKVEAELGRCVENATIIAVKNLTGTEYAWQPLRKWCKQKGVKPVEVVDSRYGLVKSWPSAAWSEVYQIELSELFNK